MNLNDPYQVYQANVTCLRGRNPLLAEMLGDVEIDSLNHTIVEGRSCTIAVNGVQLTSRHDPEAEAKLRCEALTEWETVDIFGFECGFAARHLLEHYGDIKHMRIHVLNLKIFKLVMHLGSLDDIIENGKVQISYASDAFFTVRGKYVANPAELVTADDNNWKIRDALLYRNLIEYSNKKFITAWGDNTSSTAYDAYTKYDGVNELFDTYTNQHFYIIGAGPTLEKNITRLKAILDINPTSPIIACDTAVNGLLQHKIRPNYIVTTDPEIADRYLATNACPGVPLICGIHTPHQYIDAWQGPIYLYVSNVGEYDKYDSLSQKGKLFGGGSVIHPATDLAVKMGADSVTFIGADFCFPYKKTHSFWKEGELGVRADGKHWVLNGHGDRVPTNTNFAYYLVALEYLIAISNRTAFFTASLDGAKISGTDFDPTFGEI